MTDKPAQSFYGLGIAPKILDILERIKFKVPTPIQLKAIPLALEGKDIIGIAQTGTGKTHSFAIPMVQILAQKKGIGLVLAPTRELAIQIDEAFQGITRPFGIRTACLIGGASMYEQVRALRNKPRVIIATPGRLIDHMTQWNILLDDAVMLVLDEADRMLDMGFTPQVEKIFWAFFRDTKKHWDNGVDYFGLVRWDYSAKSSFKAYKERFQEWKKNKAVKVKK